MLYRFDDCELDPGRVVLRRAGDEVPIEPQVFDLLRLLIERRGQMVTKEELLDEVWGDRFVSESALTSRIKSARRAVGDDGRTQAVIRTVHGRGYEFVAVVREIHDTDEADPVERIDEHPPTPRQHGADLSPGRAQPLPLPVHSLIGRDALLDELVEALATGRLLTIVGPAGVGKTSIGLEVARRSVASYPDGVALVELVAVRDQDGALAAVATALDVNIRQGIDLGEAIVDMLRPRHLLLVIDNCEHLVEPLAALSERVLRSAPNVTILATGREPLSIGGENVHIVEPLDVQELHDLDLDQLRHQPAVELFVERARAVDARFELTESNAPAVAEICRRLDGIPLALELAASRTHAIDIAEIALRLDERLRLLRAVRRGGADPRHGTLFDAISWSYDLLEPDEQRLFAELTVFAADFDLDGAESICSEDDVLDLLTRLTQRSMVVVRRPRSGGTRYELLETLREFGRSRLDDATNATLFAAHADHYTKLAESVGAGLRTQAELDASRRADHALSDLRAAQRFAVQIGDADRALRLITSIREYAMRSLRYEVLGWAAGAEHLVEDADHPLGATLTALSGYGAWVRGEFESAASLGRRAIELQEQRGEAPSGLAERVLSNVLFLVGEVDAAREMCTRMIEIAESSGIPSNIAHANYMGSIGLGTAEELEDLARQRYERAFAAARTSGSPTDLASAWAAKGFATRHDDEAALDAFASADRLARSAGNRWLSAFARTEASSLLVKRGDLERGCRGLAETVDVWYRAGEWAQQWLTLSRCVIALDRVGEPELAAEVFGALERHTSVDAQPVIPSIRDLALSTRTSVIEQLGTGPAAEHLATGAATPETELVHRTRLALLAVTDD